MQIKVDSRFSDVIRVLNRIASVRFIKTDDIWVSIVAKDNRVVIETGTDMHLSLIHI